MVECKTSTKTYCTFEADKWDDLVNELTEYLSRTPASVKMSSYNVSLGFQERDGKYSASVEFYTRDS